MTRQLLLTTIAIAALAACSGNPSPTSPGSTSPFPGAVSTAGGAPAPVSSAPRSVDVAPPVLPSPPPVTGKPLAGSVESINDNSPLQPVFFLYDSDTLDDEARKVLAENATILKSNGSWAITIEGHCDERGTPEYNLALGDRRALAVRNYLVSIGVEPDRLRTVSYGKEFPFDPGHEEASWSQNRRAHFMLTGK
jgi:peptidoglycan-associated lipoprotein